MAYCRMGEVSDGMIDGVSAPGLGLDLTQWVPREWMPGPLTTTGLTPSPLVTTGVPAMAEGGIPELLARPAETGESPPWLLLAGLGLVAYMVMK
jgi:hypothetical protein